MSEFFALDLAQALEGAATRLRRSVVEVRPGGRGAGAGVIWRADGTIVTNYHVAAGDHAEVILADGRTFRGTVTARDVPNDLAVLRVPADGLPAAPVGDARTLRPGELVLAVGHPFGVKGTLTVGVVSTAHRPARVGAMGRELVVADVRLGPGNSGGPLADARGRVVGVNAMVAGGMGLAVPSHLVERLLGAETRPSRLGLESYDVELAPVQVAAANGARRGLLVVGIQAGGAAAAAGLTLGDIVVAVDGVPTPRGEALAGYLAARGDVPLTLAALRGETLRDLTVAAAAPLRSAA